MSEASTIIPHYLTVSASDLGRGQPVKVTIKADVATLGRDMAQSMFEEICAAQRQGRGATLIVPVGPVEPFPLLARRLNEERVSCRDVVFINMDEYLTGHDEWLPEAHPLSFRGFMNRLFYQLLQPELAPSLPQRVFPDPRDPAAIGKLIRERGGVDACYGGIGINGHLAFNEPPEPGESVSTRRFASLPTRVLNLSRETRTINAVTVGGEISLIPKRAITVGMKEILAAKRLRFYCNRPWQRGVVRRALHGPLTPRCPASLLRLHPKASLTLSEGVAEPPHLQLR